MNVTEGTLDAFHRIAARIILLGKSGERAPPMPIFESMIVDPDGHHGKELVEPSRSLWLLYVLGSRPIEIFTILEAVLQAEKSLGGMELAGVIADTLNRELEGEAKVKLDYGGYYKTHIGKFLGYLTQLGILQTETNEGVRYSIPPGLRPTVEQVTRDFIEGRGLLFFQNHDECALHIDPVSYFETKFNKRYQKVVSDSNEPLPFSIEELMDSVKESGINTSECLELLVRIDPDLRPNMKTNEIGNLIYRQLEKIDSDAAAKYRSLYVKVPIIGEDKTRIGFLDAEAISKLLNDVVFGYKIRNKIRSEIASNTLEMFRLRAEVTVSEVRQSLEYQVSGKCEIPSVAPKSPKEYSTHKLESAAKHLDFAENVAEIEKLGAYAEAIRAAEDDLLRAVLAGLKHAPLHVEGERGRRQNFSAYKALLKDQFLQKFLVEQIKVDKSHITTLLGLENIDTAVANVTSAENPRTKNMVRTMRLILEAGRDLVEKTENLWYVTAVAKPGEKDKMKMVGDLFSKANGEGMQLIRRSEGPELEYTILGMFLEGPGVTEGTRAELSRLYHELFPAKGATWEPMIQQKTLLDNPAAATTFVLQFSLKKHDEKSKT